MADRKCVKKILGDVMKISNATPKQLRQIEKCTILAAGGTPNPKVFGKSKRGYKQPGTLKVGNNTRKEIAAEGIGGFGSNATGIKQIYKKK